MLTHGPGPRLRVQIDAARVTSWMAALADAELDLPPHRVLGEFAACDEELGTQRAVLAEHAKQVFGYAELANPASRAALVDDAARIVVEAEPRARRATELLAGRFFHDDLDLVTRLVPGTRLCYGLPGGGQVFGMVPGASVEEMCCFLEHTFYHELSDQWASERSARSEKDQQSSAAVVTWILSLVRNEGIANLYCLDELAAMKQPMRWAYFTYAPLIGCEDATLAALNKLAQALEAVANQGVADATAFVNGTLKNPNLPLINLVGIHLAKTIVDTLGESGLAQLCFDEPEHFVAAWLESGDPHIDALDGETRARLAHWAQVRW